MTWMLLFLYSPPEERTPANGGDGYGLLLSWGPLGKGGPATNPFLYSI